VRNEIRDTLAGKTALITGGTRGIGRALASAYARAGARVFICGRREEELQRVVKELRYSGGEVQGVAGDVGRAEDVGRIVRAAVNHYGTIHVAVNNASLLGPRDPISNHSAAAWEAVLRVNLTGPFLVIQEVLKIMMPQRQGSIINVSSGVGRVGKPRWGAYSVSKFGLEGLTQLLAEELKEAGIRVNAINPGPTRTDMRAQAYPDEDPLTIPLPDDIMPVFLYLASDKSIGVTGKSLDAQGWLKQPHHSGIDSIDAPG
jgi:NAD(P)-dependent dehydrogenase (short-subunit alcohol dehydrogenase family)